MDINVLRGETPVAALRAAHALGARLFGDRQFIFRSGGLWHIGRFTDNLPPTSRHGRDPKSPHLRPCEVFAVDRDLEAAMRKITGPKALYSFAGAPAGFEGARGARPVFDKKGNIRGYESAAGIFSKNFPGGDGAYRS